MKMKSLIAVSLLFLLTTGVFAAETAAGAPVQVKVKGMVCAFCAQGLDKKFRAQPAVEDVKVSLGDKLIKLTLKEGQTLDDAAIRKIVQDAGYNIESIKR
jgi:copper chaperone CopZ